MENISLLSSEVSPHFLRGLYCTSNALGHKDQSEYRIRNCDAQLRLVTFGLHNEI
jgi:hypothetical protein